MNRDPEKLRAWKQRSARRAQERARQKRRLARPSKRPKPWRQSPGAAARARKRKAERRQKQFGPKREAVIRLRCLVSGRFPVDPAHVLGTRGAGHDSTGLAPLHREVHRAFDGSMTDERFEARWGKSREWIRQWARDFDEEWREAHPEEGSAQ